jgi:hypothetical protein
VPLNTVLHPTVLISAALRELPTLLRALPHVLQAPELLLNGRASKASDTYSFGILLVRASFQRRACSWPPSVINITAVCLSCAALLLLLVLSCCTAQWEMATGKRAFKGGLSGRQHAVQAGRLSVLRHNCTHLTHPLGSHCHFHARPLSDVRHACCAGGPQRHAAWPAPGLGAWREPGARAAGRGVLGAGPCRQVRVALPCVVPEPCQRC